MIVFCEECGTRYQLDPNKFKYRQITARCRTCGHLMTIERPEPSSSDEKRSPENASSKPSAEPSHPNPGRQKEPAAHRKPGATFSGKLGFWMVLVAMVPFTCFWWSAANYMESRIRSEVEERLTAVSKSLSLQMDHWSDAHVRMLSLAAETPAIGSMTPQLQEPILKAVTTTHPWIHHAFTLDAGGKRLSVSGDASAALQGRGPADAGLVAAHKPIWEISADEIPGRPAVILSVPVRAAGNATGALAAAIPLEKLEQMITLWPGEQGVEVFVADDKGRVLLRQGSGEAAGDLEAHPLFEDPGVADTGWISYNRGELGMLGRRILSRSGWQISVEQQTSRAFSEIDNLRRVAWALFAVVLLAVLLMAAFSAELLARPLKRLTKATRSISLGDLGADIHTDSRDEIGDLSEAVDRLRESIRIFMEKSMDNGRPHAS